MSGNTVAYMRLTGGGWGLRVEGDCSPGMTVIAVRRAGAAQEHVIGRILWMKNGVFGCTIASSDEAARLAARPRTAFDKRRHVTRSTQPWPTELPPDDGVTPPFDPPYLR